MSMIRSFFNRDFGYSPFHRFLEITAILSFYLLVAVILHRVYSGFQYLSWQTTAWLIPVTMILGYIGADFASGVVHWMGDTFGSEKTPVLGERFIKPFRDHHTHPNGILEHDYVTVNGNNSMVLALFLIAVIAIFRDPSSTLQLIVLSSCVSFSVGIYMTNQFHKWSHMENPPLLIDLLQRTGLILGREHHDIHHISPFDTYYCITCGWLNPLLQRIRFFETMEKVVCSVLPVRIARDDLEN